MKLIVTENLQNFTFQINRPKCIIAIFYIGRGGPQSKLSLPPPTPPLLPYPTLFRTGLNSVMFTGNL